MRRRALVVVASVATLLCLCGLAFGAWTGIVDGTATARSQSLAGNQPTGTPTGGDVLVSWTASTFSDSTAATSYTVRRYQAVTGTEQTVLSGCAGSVAATTCTESSVPAGSWQYTITPKYADWTGAESTKSDVVVVVASGDTTPPELATLEMFDGTNAATANGKIDRVVATFSETLAAYTAGTTPWVLTDVPSGGSLSSVTVSGSTATLTLTEGTGAADTSVGAFTVTLLPNPNGVRDAAGNMSSFAATAPTDKAAPVPVSLTLGSNNGTIAKNDTVTVVYSEKLKVSSLCSAWSNDNNPQALNNDSNNLKITVANSGSNDLLTVASTTACTFNFGQVASGGDYVTSSVDFGPDTGGNKSTIGWTASSETLLITLGRITGSGTVASTAVPATPAPTVTYTPSTSITDPAGNPMTSTAFSVTGQRF